MLVPRSYRYSSPSAESQHNHNHTTMKGRSSRGSLRSNASSAENSPVGSLRSNAPSVEHSPVRPSISPLRPKAEPVEIPRPKTPQDTAHVRQNGDRSRRGSAADTIRRQGRHAHDPHAMPPAVAALLAMTTIPPRRPNRYRTRHHHDQPVSIEELVSSWKSDDSLRSSYGSPGLISMLLDDADDSEDGVESRNEESYFNARSSSSDSMPSLEADDRSVASFGSLSTPESLRSRKSITNLRREKQRSLPRSQECLYDHPLAPQTEVDDGEDEDEDALHLPFHGKHMRPRKQSSFKSNLTLSLQSLKNAAISSISSLSRTNTPTPQRATDAGPIDDVLWSHPFLFPRFSSEVRPATDSRPSPAQRRYLNPMPLTFEEQEAPFQKALHAPYLREALHDDGVAPKIPLQTYNRKSRKPRRTSPDPNSEAGRALLGHGGVRPREVRENSDFLRIVVMEMNMRRLGKLESGRARIWLPPREATPVVRSIRGQTPRRWIGVSASSL